MSTDDAATCGARKILVRLAHDHNGYPTASVEGLWAQPVEGGYRIDSLPFHAYDVAPGDIVEVRIDGEMAWLERVRHSSGASVLRVIVKAADELNEVLVALQQFACPCELERSTRMIAVHVPAQVGIDALLYFLLVQRQAGVVDFEEGVLRHRYSAGLPL
ncbi:DUF4265 domain-containing protein [Pseudomonas cremoricolorata]|uniref:DUF4265 domain-containing protein n=1 Tax=Pseudomonas cremoricolorata TaxID=157783 RepID=UPI0003FF1D60|nr:DUF4265 domain-containing protein [Pseudomonas cremoricolorata]